MSYQQAAVHALKREHEANADDGDFFVRLPSEAIITVRRRLRDLPAAVALRCMPACRQMSNAEFLVQSARSKDNSCVTNAGKNVFNGSQYYFSGRCYLARVKRFQVSSRLERLPIEPIAQQMPTSALVELVAFALAGVFVFTMRLTSRFAKKR